MEWHGLCLLHEDGQGKRRTLLINSKGSIGHGQILGILGQSGVGKSLLLRGLASDWELREGTVLFNGRVFGKRLSVGSIPFLDQFHYPLLTVRETIEFRTYFRVNDKDLVRRRATELLQIFGIEDDGVRRVGNQPVPLALRLFHRSISISIFKTIAVTLTR